MTVIEGGDLGVPEPFGQLHHRGIDHPEGEVGVPVVQVAAAQQVDAAGRLGFLDLSEERLEQLKSDLLVVGLEYDQSILDSPLYQALDVVRAGLVVKLTEPSAGSHWRNYVEVARNLLAQLEALDLRTDLV